ETFVTPGVEILELGVSSAQLGSSDFIETTTEHPFWVPERGWVHAQDLEVGDELVDSTGSSWQVDIVDPTGRFDTVYNFEVEGLHTYFAGDARVLVHNTDCDITSRIKESPKLVREAERTGKSHQRSIDHLQDELRKGNMNPGSGSKAIGQGISEARSRDGARLYFRQLGENAVEVLRKSNKGN